MPLYSGTEFSKRLAVDRYTISVRFTSENKDKNSEIFINELRRVYFAMYRPGFFFTSNVTTNTERKLVFAMICLRCIRIIPSKSEDSIRYKLIHKLSVLRRFVCWRGMLRELFISTKENKNIRRTLPL